MEARGCKGERPMFKLIKKWMVEYYTRQYEKAQAKKDQERKANIMAVAKSVR